MRSETDPTMAIPEAIEGLGVTVAKPDGKAETAEQYRGRWQRERKVNFLLLKGTRWKKLRMREI